MPRVEVLVDGHQCVKCKYIWVPHSKKKDTRKCPSCQSIKWDWTADPLTGKLTRPNGA